MTDSTNWIGRLTDRYVDLDIWSLAILGLAVAIALIANHVYFRWRLEPAVTDGIPPRTVKLEALALSLAIGAFIAGFSGWGFLWIAALLVIALVFAAMAGARAVLTAVAIFLVLAVLVTLAGLKLTTL